MKRLQSVSILTRYFLAVSSAILLLVSLNSFYERKKTLMDLEKTVTIYSSITEEAIVVSLEKIKLVLLFSW